MARLVLYFKSFTQFLKCNLADLYSPCHVFYCKPSPPHIWLHWRSKTSRGHDDIHLQSSLCIRFSTDTGCWGLSLETMCVSLSHSEKEGNAHEKCSRYFLFVLESVDSQVWVKSEETYLKGQRTWASGSQLSYFLTSLLTTGKLLKSLSSVCKMEIISTRQVGCKD